MSELVLATDLCLALASELSNFLTRLSELAGIGTDFGIRTVVRPNSSGETVEGLGTDVGNWIVTCPRKIVGLGVAIRMVTRVGYNGGNGEGLRTGIGI